MPAERNLKLISVFAFFTNCLFVVPILLPFYKDHVGIGYQGLLFGESAFAASCILFDVPTSWISDVWRRKNSLALGSAFICLASGLLLFSRNLWEVIFAQVIFGIGFSLLNGTHTAMLYDSLLSLNRENEYRKLEGKRQAFALYGIAFAGALGGFAYTIDHFLPFYLEIGAHVACLFIVGFMREPERHKLQDKKHPVSDIIKTITYVMYGHATLGIILLFGAILFCTTKVIMWSQQPYFLALGLPEQFYGIFMATAWLFGGMASHWAHLLDGKINIFRAFGVVWCVTITACLAAGGYLGYSGIPLLMLSGSCTYGMMLPRVNEVINRNVGSERRATALSTLSLLSFSLFIPFSSIVGWTADHWSIQQALFVIAAWFALTGTGLFLLKTKYVKNESPRG